jgi:perosamine synthetase
MIPVCAPHVAELELQYLADCAKSGWIGAGPYIERFESEWSTYCGRANGMAVSNGTVALELAIKSLDIPVGKKVLLPSFTIISCALAVIKNGLVPVFVDVDPSTFCIDPDDVARVIDKDTAAMIVVHMYGHPAPMDHLSAIAKNHGLLVIEDAAEAHGALYKGRQCGSFGDVSCFSFYSNKIISTGEGGMVLADDPIIADKVRSYRNLCFGLGADRFIHTGLGGNSRMTNMQAAIGCAQVSQIGEFLNAKKRMAHVYDDGLEGLSVIRPSIRDGCDPVYWMYGILARNSKALAEALRKDGIDTRPFFYPLHMQPVLAQFTTRPLPVSESISEFGLYLPSSIDISAEDQKLVIEAIRRFYGI